MALTETRPAEIDQSSIEAGIEPAFFAPIPRLNAQLSQIVSEVRTYTHSLNSDSNDLFRNLARQGISSCLSDIKTYIKDGPGQLHLRVPRSFDASARFGALLDRYGVDAPYDPAETHALIVPTAAITGVIGLARSVEGQRYDPVLNLRIQSPSDPPLEHYENFEVVPEDSPGRWHSFPLLDVDIELFPTAGN